ncbi:unnamed protein product [Brassica oleracea]
MPTAQSETHKDLTYKLWPQGNITFRETSDPEGGSWKPGNRISVSCHIPVRTMIMESFEEQPGLNPHIDSHFLTILCQNEVVDGVEIKAKDGEEWIKAKPSQGSSFLVIAGASLHVWASGSGCGSHHFPSSCSSHFVLKPSVISVTLVVLWRQAGWRSSLLDASGGI